MSYPFFCKISRSRGIGQKACRISRLFVQLASKTLSKCGSLGDYCSVLIGYSPSAMSSTGRSLLLMAKGALRSHLETVLTTPQHYLAQFRYAMDFVWAKCAF